MAVNASKFRPYTTNFARWGHNRQEEILVSLTQFATTPPGSGHDQIINELEHYPTNKRSTHILIQLIKLFVAGAKIPLTKDTESKLESLYKLSTDKIGNIDIEVSGNLLSGSGINWLQTYYNIPEFLLNLHILIDGHLQKSAIGKNLENKDEEESKDNVLETDNFNVAQQESRGKKLKCDAMKNDIDILVTNKDPKNRQHLIENIFSTLTKSLTLTNNSNIDFYLISFFIDSCSHPKIKMNADLIIIVTKLNKFFTDTDITLQQIDLLPTWTTLLNASQRNSQPRSGWSKLFDNTCNTENFTRIIEDGINDFNTKLSPLQQKIDKIHKDISKVNDYISNATKILQDLNPQNTSDEVKYLESVTTMPQKITELEKNLQAIEKQLDEINSNLEALPMQLPTKSLTNNISEIRITYEDLSTQCKNVNDTYITFKDGLNVINNVPIIIDSMSTKANSQAKALFESLNKNFDETTSTINYSMNYISEKASHLTPTDQAFLRSSLETRKDRLVQINNELTKLHQKTQEHITQLECVVKTADDMRTRDEAVVYSQKAIVISDSMNETIAKAKANQFKEELDYLQQTITTIHHVYECEEKLQESIREVNELIKDSTSNNQHDIIQRTNTIFTTLDSHDVKLIYLPPNLSMEMAQLLTNLLYSIKNHHSKNMDFVSQILVWFPAQWFELYIIPITTKNPDRYKISTKWTDTLSLSKWFDKDTSDKYEKLRQLFSMATIIEKLRAGRLERSREKLFLHLAKNLLEVINNLDADNFTNFMNDVRTNLTEYIKIFSIMVENGEHINNNPWLQVIKKISEITPEFMSELLSINPNTSIIIISKLGISYMQSFFKNKDCQIKLNYPQILELNEKLPKDQQWVLVSSDNHSVIRKYNADHWCMLPITCLNEIGKNVIDLLGTEEEQIIIQYDKKLLSISLQDFNAMTTTIRLELNEKPEERVISLSMGSEGINIKRTMSPYELGTSKLAIFLFGTYLREIFPSSKVMKVLQKIIVLYNITISKGVWDKIDYVLNNGVTMNNEADTGKITENELHLLENEIQKINDNPHASNAMTKIILSELQGDSGEFHNRIKTLLICIRFLAASSAKKLGSHGYSEPVMRTIATKLLIHMTRKNSTYRNIEYNYTIDEVPIASKSLQRIIVFLEGGNCSQMATDDLLRFLNGLYLNSDYDDRQIIMHIIRDNGIYMESNTTYGNDAHRQLPCANNPNLENEYK